MIDLGYKPLMRDDLPDLKARKEEFFALDTRYDKGGLYDVKAKIDQNTATNLKWLRELHGFTIRELASKIGIPASTIGGYEFGKSVNSERLQMFADLWHVSSECFGLDPEEFQSLYLGETHED